MNYDGMLSRSQTALLLHSAIISDIKIKLKINVFLLDLLFNILTVREYRPK